MARIFTKKSIRLVLILALALPMMAFGVIEIIQPEDFIADTQKLGYPLYFFKWLGLAKIVGALLILIPKVPAILQRLSYAGFFFDFVFAIISLITIREYLNALLPFLFLLLLSASYYLKFNEFKKQ